jgi:hypothetical protein
VLDQGERPSQKIRAARSGRRPPGFAGTAVVLMLALAVAWVFFLRAGQSPPAPAIGAVQGTFTQQIEPGDSGVATQGTFGAVASGNAAGTATPAAGAAGRGRSPSQSAYDARAREEQTVRGTGADVALLRRVGDWPPVWRVATPNPLDYQGLATIVRAAAEDHDALVGIKPLKDGGRVVWRAALTLAGKSMEFVVDQKTGLVLWYTDGHTTTTFTVAWSSPPPADQTYSVGVSGQTAKTVSDDAYTYFASPAAAGRAAGYAPLVSDLAPDGYELRAVATATADGLPATWLRPDASAPAVLPASRRVALLYARGLTWFTVEQLGPEAAAAWSRSGGGLRPYEPDTLSLQATTLQYGALAGSTAYTWYTLAGPTLLVGNRRAVVYVTGSLTRQELISFAEGLRPAAAAGTTSSSPSSSGP